MFRMPKPLTPLQWFDDAHGNDEKIINPIEDAIWMSPREDLMERYIAPDGTVFNLDYACYINPDDILFFDDSPGFTLDPPTYYQVLAPRGYAFYRGIILPKQEVRELGRNLRCLAALDRIMNAERIDFSESSPTPEYPLGTQASDARGNTYRYVRASIGDSPISPGSFVADEPQEIYQDPNWAPFIKCAPTDRI